MAQIKCKVFYKTAVEPGMWEARAKVLCASLKKAVGGFEVVHDFSNISIEDNFVCLMPIFDRDILQKFRELKCRKKILISNVQATFDNVDAFQGLENVWNEGSDESVGSLKPAGWMKFPLDESTVRPRPHIGRIGIGRLSNNSAFQKALYSTDWCYFSLAQLGDRHELLFYEGPGETEKAVTREDYDPVRLIKMLLAAKTLVFEDLTKADEFLFLEAFFNSAQIVVDQEIKLAALISANVLRVDAKDPIHQGELMGQALNDFMLNIFPKALVTVEERVQEIVKFLSSQ